MSFVSRFGRICKSIFPSLQDVVILAPRRQRVCVLSSYRMIWQAVLDRELCLMAALRDEPFLVKQMRVDGAVLHANRTHSPNAREEEGTSSWTIDRRERRGS